ncbi:murein biosynthesis integral membrane protein MurJ [Chitinimonas lacunae]|uniref:Probable lipid II flippase MurJ n=1 Tax=Chitinimonas lacunae TaxID=1963018 RepID=A0ABV8MR19_9NEIS
MNLLKTLARTSSMTMLSRVLGLVRETLNSHLFGAGAAMDAFNVAFRLPNLLRRIFAEGAFSQAFVPILAQYKTQRGDDAARELIAHVAGLLTLVLALVTLLGVVGAPLIVLLSAQGFSSQPEKFALTVELTRWTFPYILLISLSSLAGSILNTWNRYSVPAFTPALLNIAFIGCALALAPHLDQPIFALAIGLLLGGVAQLLFQLPYLRQIRMLPLPRLNLRDPGVWQVLKQMGPAIFGVSVSQISILINTNFASHLPTGSLSWMAYADRLMELPTGVLGVALGTILLPSLAKLRSQGAEDDYSALLDWGLRLCWLLALPATVALAVIAEPLVSTLYQSGHFRLFDSQMTQRALLGYAVGLMGLIVIKVLAPAYYARQNMRTPVLIGIATLIVTQALNLLFVFGPLRLPGWEHAGLSLAISLGACFNAALLYVGLRRSGVYRPQPGWVGFAGRLLVAVTVMIVVLLLAQHGLGDWQTDRLVRVGKLALLVTLGAAAYFGALGLLGFRPADFRRRAA